MTSTHSHNNEGQTIEKIAEVITLAEGWIENQALPESDILRAAMKDIRRIVRAYEK